MTRDYNKQRRDDVRPSSRNQSTHRHRDEQPPRPARPRLNRETVDRAWEDGAATQHYDYRSRRSNTSNGHPPRDNWHYNQSSEHSPARKGRKPSANQTNNNRRFERTPDNNSVSRSRSFNSDRGRFDDQRTNHPGSRANAYPQAHARRSPYRDNEQYRGNQRRDSASYDRQPREFGRDSRAPRNVEREGRAGYQPPTRDAQNPRWQSRPTAQRGDSPNGRVQDNGLAPLNAQFEGDYEGFRAHEYAEQQERSHLARINSEHSKPQAEERPVTRLPDGRVLKGPRPSQRRNAQFWTGVTQETKSLLEPIATISHDAEATPVTQVEEPAVGTSAQVPGSSIAEVDQDKPKTLRKPRARTASPAARKKKTTDVAAKPRSTGPKPSQRGYKWPAS